jgi:cytochrome c-type biogenesis protein CcmH/NrfF
LWHAVLRLLRRLLMLLLLGRVAIAHLQRKRKRKRGQTLSKQRRALEERAQPSRPSRPFGSKTSLFVK